MSQADSMHTLNPVPEWILSASHESTIKRAEAIKLHWESERIRIEALLQLQEYNLRNGGINTHINMRLNSLESAVTAVVQRVSGLADEPVMQGAEQFKNPVTP